jgi:small subunit ribosomal protein S21
LAEVRMFEGESIESALRGFKRQVQQEGIIKEVKKHSFYVKLEKRNAPKVSWLKSSNARRCDDQSVLEISSVYNPRISQGCGALRVR